MRLSWIFGLLLAIIACQLTSVDAKKGKSGSVKSKSKSKTKTNQSKPGSGSVKNKPSSSSASKKKNKIKKALERQLKAKLKFKAMKKISQLDRMMGDNTLRADRHGGKLEIQRKGQFFGMRIKQIVEKHSNDTVVCQKYFLKLLLASTLLSINVLINLWIFIFHFCCKKVYSNLKI